MGMLLRFLMQILISLFGKQFFWFLVRFLKTQLQNLLKCLVFIFTKTSILTWLFILLVVLVSSLYWN